MTTVLNCNECTTCKDAAERDHLVCLKYARKNGCPWNVDLCNDAARSCSSYKNTSQQEQCLECLKYINENRQQDNIL